MYYTIDKLLCELSTKEFLVKRCYGGYSEIPFLYFDYRRTYMPVNITNINEYDEIKSENEIKTDLCRKYLDNSPIGSELIFPMFNVEGELTEYIIYSKIDSEKWEKSYQYFGEEN